MQAPRWINQAGAKAPGWIGRQLETLGSKVPELAAPEELTQGMQNWSKSVMRRRPETGLRGAEEALGAFSQRMRGMSPAELAAQQSAPRSSDLLGNIARKMAVNYAPPEKMLSYAHTGQQVGRGLGRGIDALARTGEGLEKLSEDAVGAGLRGIEAGGRVAQVGGRVAKNLGTAAQPFENRVLGRYGEDEGLDWLDNRLRRAGLANSTVPTDFRGVGEYQ
jgi:hypothetical protein